MRVDSLFVFYSIGVALLCFPLFLLLFFILFGHHLVERFIEPGIFQSSEEAIECCDCKQVSVSVDNSTTLTFHDITK